MGFKIVGILPHKDLNKRHRKNLKFKVYPLTQKYDFKNYSESDPVIRHRYIDSPDLFNINFTHTGLKGEEINILPINISAIVGKNGSGKSSIIELVYAGFYNFSIKHEILFVEKPGLIENLNLEIFYEIDQQLYSLVLSNGPTSTIKSYHERNGVLEKKEIFIIRSKADALQIQDKLFYNLAINYSLYNLNPNEIGDWINNIYHKNDSYQTPIVLNPYRTNGNIDINSENYLSRSRYISLVLNSEAPVIINQEKSVEAIEIRYNKKDFENYLNKYVSVKEKTENSQEIANAKKAIEVKLPELYKRFRIKKANPELKLTKKAEEYLLRKLIMIPKRYKTFKVYRDSKTFLDLNSLDSYFKDLYEDRSHITLKLRQILNFIDYQDYVDDEILEKKKIFLIKDIRAKFQAVFQKRNLEFNEVIDFILPPIFDVDFIFDINEKNHRFSALSSGEKQRLFCFNSILYHLRNLISVRRNVKPTDLIIYKNINIIFDEIELYFHPEFQRSFINDLIELLKNSLKQFSFEQLPNLNFIFITHSPFILSDIPGLDILYLAEDGTPLDSYIYQKPSFGANITDLLADSFFLSDGLMGNFAKNKIEEVINFINEKPKNKSKETTEDLGYYRKIIDTVDEPILQRKLAEMYDERFKTGLEKDLLLRQRAQIEEQLKKLEG